MTLPSTDSPNDHSEQFWRELSEDLLMLNPAIHDPGHLLRLALEAASRLVGGGGGWLETNTGDGFLIRARMDLEEEELYAIRGRIDVLQHPEALSSPSVIHIPEHGPQGSPVLLLPLVLPDAPIPRCIGAIVLLPKNNPPAAYERRTLEQLAAIIARQVDQNQRTSAELAALSKRLHSYETLTQRSYAGMYRSTEAGQVLQCNAAVARMMGFNSPEELMRVNAHSFYATIEERRNLWHTLDERGGSALIEATRIRRDGQPIRLLQDLQLFPDEPNGDPILHGTLFELPDAPPATEPVQTGASLYRKMIEKHGDAVVLVDRDTRILYCGPSVERVFGYRPEELVHQIGLDYVHPEDQILARSQLRKLFTGTAVLTAELRLRHRNGLWLWFEITASNQLDDPVLQGILLTYRDITGRRQQEELLYRTERRHQLIFEASGDVIWDWDIKTNSVRISGSFQTLFGYTPDQIEPNVSWWFLRIHPEDVERMARSFESSTYLSQDFWSEEFRVRCANGEWGFAFSRGYLLRDRERSPLRMTGALTDMTAHHRLHRLLEEGYGNIPIGFLAVSAEGMLVYANPAARQLLGEGERKLSGVHLMHDDQMRQFSFIRQVETALREHTPRRVVESHPKRPEQLQADLYPSDGGVVIYLQSAPAVPTGSVPHKARHPLQVVAHLPTLVSSLVKPLRHRRP